MAIKIAKPSDAEAKQYPREFAIYTQIPGALSGSVSSEDLTEAVKTFGSGTAPSGDKITFEQLAQALHKGGTADFGGGNTVGYAAKDASSPLEPWAFDRRPAGSQDIVIQIAYCGICHSDVHQIRNEWGNTVFSCVPGHEIVGIVTEVGSKAAQHFKVGDRAGVGCFVRACRDCELCKIGDDQYCQKCVLTYNGKDWGDDGKLTYGGYSNRIIVNHQNGPKVPNNLPMGAEVPLLCGGDHRYGLDEAGMRHSYARWEVPKAMWTPHTEHYMRCRYALRVPENLSMAAAAPLLCAGITTYSPMKHYGLDKAGMKLGVVGLGGLGHMAVKFGKGFGMEVTVISTSPKKEKEAREALGADHFVVSKDEARMSAIANTLDGIIDTVSAKHDISQLLPLLKTNGRLILLGVPPDPHSFSAGALLFKRLTIAGSLIGGIKETQEMLDFCGEKNITCDVEEVNADQVNEAIERLMKNDVHYRFSINVLNSIIPA